MSLADLRRDYALQSLDESDVAADPFEQFKRWFDDALKAEIPDANAMSLATVANSTHGFNRPTQRIVLLKGLDASGFVFFTNYQSRKGEELAANPLASLLFYWAALERQVRIEGRVECVTAEESDEYFGSRPVKSRLGAIASPQSRVIASRQQLEQRVEEAQEKYGDNPPRPGFWGGYRLVPDYLEFWQGRRSRLHDRIVYQKDGESWKIVRLAP